MYSSLQLSTEEFVTAVSHELSSTYPVVIQRTKKKIQQPTITTQVRQFFNVIRYYMFRPYRAIIRYYCYKNKLRLCTIKHFLNIFYKHKY
jgi:hypothetical protein